MIAFTEKQDISVNAIVRRAHAAQPAWSRRPARERAKIIGALRPFIARAAEHFARGEKLVSEILPLLEACRFLERNATRILRTQRFGAAGRPVWLRGSSFEVVRKPFGVVLVIGPSNYPLFLPLVHALHALVAGNTVVLKPAEGTSHLLDNFFAKVQLPRDLIQLLPEPPESAHAALDAGIDKAIFTGSSENGRAFLADLAKKNIPSVMELSGADVVYVRADADLTRAAKAIAFGLRLNGGNTCMAPHLVIAHEPIVVPLQTALKNAGASIEIIAVRDDEQALEIAALDHFGLGASIFSRDEKSARALADRLTTGFVTINDLIVPTADPRFPFCATHGSGFGVTRGAEGLLEMTYPQSIAVRRGKFLRHLDPPRAGDERIFASFIQLAHGRGRLRALGNLLRAIRRRS